MKIARKEFQHPDGFFPKEFSWWKSTPKDKKKNWNAYTLSEIHQQFFDFVNEIGKENVVSINEYSTMKTFFGDDKVTHFVVWYWTED